MLIDHKCLFCVECHPLLELAMDVNIRSHVPTRRSCCTTRTSRTDVNTKQQPQAHNVTHSPARTLNFAMAPTLYPRGTLKKIVKAHANRPLSKNVDILVRLLPSAWDCCGRPVGAALRSGFTTWTSLR